MALTTKQSGDIHLRDLWDWTVLGGATPNVIMQLALKPVGYGVAESVVDSGNVLLHPVKRLRTTLSYLAVVVLGTEEEKDLYRQEVDVAHRYVHSARGAEVKYNAFDPELQLWVAACLYQGFVQGQEILRGPLGDLEADMVYAEAEALATTLQVTPDMWPADREAFEKYWEAGIEETEIDGFTRAHLWQLVDLEMLPRWMRLRPLVTLSRFLAAGFLPEEFRVQMHMDWNDGRQRRFDRLFRVIGRFSRLQPRLMREFPLNFYMWDLRRRIKAGKPLIGTTSPRREVKPGACPM